MTEQTWVLARSRTKRPTLMHLLSKGSARMTACGLDISAWSRAYFHTPIPQVQCLRCAKYS